MIRWRCHYLLTQFLERVNGLMARKLSPLKCWMESITHFMKFKTLNLSIGHIVSRIKLPHIRLSTVIWLLLSLLASDYNLKKKDERKPTAICEYLFLKFILFLQSSNSPLNSHPLESFFKLISFTNRKKGKSVNKVFGKSSHPNGRFRSNDKQITMFLNFFNIYI